MKLYDWDVECVINEKGKEPRTETVRVQAINDERVARAGAVAKLENVWPPTIRAIARRARQVGFVKEFV